MNVATYVAPLPTAHGHAAHDAADSRGRECRAGERCVTTNAPSKIRTCDLLIRSQTLYPTELWAREGGIPTRRIGGSQPSTSSHATNGADHRRPRRSGARRTTRRSSRRSRRRPRRRARPSAASCVATSFSQPASSIFASPCTLEIGLCDAAAFLEVGAAEPDAVGARIDRVGLADHERVGGVGLHIAAGRSRPSRFAALLQIAVSCLHSELQLSSHSRECGRAARPIAASGQPSRCRHSHRASSAGSVRGRQLQRGCHDLTHARSRGARAPKLRRWRADDRPDATQLSRRTRLIRRRPAATATRRRTPAHLLCASAGARLSRATRPRANARRRAARSHDAARRCGRGGRASLRVPRSCCRRCSTHESTTNTSSMSCGCVGSS